MYRNHRAQEQPLSGLPAAVAVIHGSRQYPSIGGTLKLYSAPHGVLVVSHITGLPKSSDPCGQPIFALHIHEGESCSGNATDPFSNARTHYNPQHCPHPYHAGDLPPLFGANGIAFSAVLTNRFSIDEILGKTVVIHASPDDFTTQPAGNAGVKIACGEIRPTKR